MSTEIMLEVGKAIAIIIFWLYATYVSDKRRESREQRRMERVSAGLCPSLERDQLVNTRLAQLLVLVNADKAKIFRFHNGGHYYNGQSIKKFSLTHLQLKNGVAGPKATDLKDLPTSLFPQMLSLLSKTTGIPVHWDIDSPPDDFLKSIHLQEGTVFVKSLALRDVSGQMLGFLQVDWITNQTEVDIDRRKVLLSFAVEIGNLLSLDTDKA